MRLDRKLVALGLADSRSRAQSMISAGLVRVDGVVAKKASAEPPETAKIEAVTPHPYVSRAALKLLSALETFSLSPKGEVAVDVGASTGGFTEVLLEHGAERVYAVDVGRDQLHPKLHKNARIVRLEGQNARFLSAQHIPEQPGWVVCDASFISLEKVLPATLELAKSGSRLVALVKPQFEVGPKQVGKGGIVKDPALRAECVDRVAAWLNTVGWTVEGTADSPIAGSDGNQETLITAVKTL